MSLNQFTKATAGVAVTTTYFTNGESNPFSMIYLFGFIAFQWLANFIMIKESNI